MHDGGAVGVAALDWLLRELQIRCVLGRVGHANSAERGTGGGFPAGGRRERFEAGRALGQRPRRA